MATLQLGRGRRGLIHVVDVPEEGSLNVTWCLEGTYAGGALPHRGAHRRDGDRLPLGDVGRDVWWWP